MSSQTDSGTPIQVYTKTTRRDPHRRDVLRARNARRAARRVRNALASTDRVLDHVGDEALSDNPDLADRVNKARILFGGCECEYGESYDGMCDCERALSDIKAVYHDLALVDKRYRRANNAHKAALAKWIKAGRPYHSGINY